LDDPALSDQKYDKLYRALKELEAEHPQLIHADSPTQRVGSELRSALRQVPHVAPMMSLDNTYTEHDIKEFVRRVEDGLAAGPRRGVRAYEPGPT
jgi:DNA ligase (NAD+)